MQQQQLREVTNNDTEKKLWSSFYNVKHLPKDDDRYIKARNDLIVYNNPILIDISAKLAKRLKELQPEEIASYGFDGLVDAIESYQPDRETKFKTWATIRIRGSVIDNIRKMDWVPRLVRQRSSMIERTRNRLESALGEITDQQMADELSMPLEEYLEIAKKAIPITQVSMNTKPKGDNSEDYDELGDIVTRAKNAPPGDNLIREEMYKKLLGKNFTKPERIIVYLHYYEGLTMKEVAEVMEFSESRISQMHADIIRRLKKKVERNPDYAADLQRLLES